MGERQPTILVQLIKERSLSVRKLATLTGIPPAAISELCTGKRQARQYTLDRLATALQIDSAVLSPLLDRTAQERGRLGPVARFKNESLPLANKKPADVKQHWRGGLSTWVGTEDGAVKAFKWDYAGALKLAFDGGQRARVYRGKLSQKEGTTRARRKHQEFISAWQAGAVNWPDEPEDVEID